MTIENGGVDHDQHQYPIPQPLSRLLQKAYLCSRRGDSVGIGMERETSDGDYDSSDYNNCKLDPISQCVEGLVGKVFLIV